LGITTEKPIGASSSAAATLTQRLSMKVGGSSIASGLAASCPRYSYQVSEERRCSASSSAPSDVAASRILIARLI
jgi:hypothetical protein